MKIGVLGGGLAGVSLAYFLQKNGHEVEVLEKEAECGGLCRSFSKNGFTFDLGGHIIFSKDKDILQLMIKMLGKNVQKRYRNNKVWFKDSFVKYPFENGLSDLDKEEAFDCLYDFIVNNHPRPKNFKEWLYHTFGNGIAEKYLIPYNEKIWNCQAETMGLEWVERVPKPAMTDIIKSALGFETEGYTHQLNFYYPKRGGIQALVGAFEQKLKKVTNNFSVKKVRRVAPRRWIVSDGRQEREYEKIISCLPIFDLATALSGIPAAISTTIFKLKYNSLTVAMIGIDQKNLSDKVGVYFPQRNIPFHRICYNSYMGRWYTPPGKSSIVAEMTTNPGDGLHELADRQLIKRVVGGLAKEGFIDPRTVCESEVKRMRYGYVVYDLNYQKRIKLIKKYFSSINLPLCGRFAEFEYLNMDVVIGRAKSLAGKMEARK
ncbi:MAG: FAD-dependent oxidoreductase [bacterium]